MAAAPRATGGAVLPPETPGGRGTPAPDRRPPYGGPAEAESVAERGGGGARRRIAVQRTGSFTLSTRSAAIYSSRCTIPEGQRTSTSSAEALGPRPKCTGPTLEEAYPTLVV